MGPLSDYTYVFPVRMNEIFAVYCEALCTNILGKYGEVKIFDTFFNTITVIFQEFCGNFVRVEKKIWKI